MSREEQARVLRAQEEEFAAATRRAVEARTLGLGAHL
jgi:hypothetical protein